MKIVLEEDYLRKIIKESILNEVGFKGKVNISGTTSGSSSNYSSSYEGPLVTIANGKKYIGDPSTGLSPPGFWDGFRNKLETHIKGFYPDLEIRIDNLGVTRDLEQAADTGGNNARVSGSKHGCGMAQDVYMHTRKYGRYDNFETMNPKLAGDQKLVDAIIDFMKKSENSDLIWGGSFGSGSTRLESGTQPRDRGILEFHHFEFKGSKIPSFFSRYEDELEKLNIRSSQLTNTRALKELYLALI